MLKLYIYAHSPPNHSQDLVKFLKLDFDFYKIKTFFKVFVYNKRENEPIDKNYVSLFNNHLIFS
jgi:hypothetical protein